MSGNEIWFLVFVLLLLLVVSGKKRSRHIPTKSKRLAKSKLYEQFYSNPENRGKKLNEKDYEYDHGYPFSAGGSHEPHNIRLIPKKKNRSKGAKVEAEFNPATAAAVIGLLILLYYFFNHR